MCWTATLSYNILPAYAFITESVQNSHLFIEVGRHDSEQAEPVVQ